VETHHGQCLPVAFREKIREYNVQMRPLEADEMVDDGAPGAAPRAASVAIATAGA
jgi:hypothetical protein